MTGVLKDILIVLFGVMLFHEHVSVLQAIGFALQIGGIVVYSMIKAFPAEFPEQIEDADVDGIEVVEGERLVKKKGEALSAQSTDLFSQLADFVLRRIADEKFDGNAYVERELLLGGKKSDEVESLLSKKGGRDRASSGDGLSSEADTMSDLLDGDSRSEDVSTASDLESDSRGTMDTPVLQQRVKP